MTMAMDQNNSNIKRLLEMLDNPASYSEQEIHDIINADDDTREAYRLMSLAADASHARRTDEAEADVDAAWRAFERRHFPAPRRQVIPWAKIAAAIVGVLFISGIAVAAVRGMMRHVDVVKTEPREVTITPPADTTVTVAIEEPRAPVSFDNVPLGEILDKMADYYGVEVVFGNDDVRQLRFHYEWDPAAGLPTAIDGLNHFKRVNISQSGNQLIVKRT